MAQVVHVHVSIDVNVDVDVVVKVVVNVIGFFFWLRRSCTVFIRKIRVAPCPLANDR